MLLLQSREKRSLPRWKSNSDGYLLDEDVLDAFFRRLPDLGIALQLVERVLKQRGLGPVIEHERQFAERRKHRAMPRH
jgi:hypothetical protein